MKPSVLGLVDQSGQVIFITRSRRASPDYVLNTIITGNRGGKGNNQVLNDWLEHNPKPTVKVLEQFDRAISNTDLRAAMNKWIARLGPKCNTPSGTVTVLGNYLTTRSTINRKAVNRQLRASREAANKPLAAILWNK